MKRRMLALCLLIVLVAPIMLLIQTNSVLPVEAQITKPSVPEFTLKYADHSYDVPSTTISTFNPYNNQTTITTIPGYHVQNLTIDITIKNQPIPSTIDGNKSYLLFWIRLKGHYGNDSDWIYPYGYGTFSSYPEQSDSYYTVISLPTDFYNYCGNGDPAYPLLNLQNGDRIDFQVMAILAYEYKRWGEGADPFAFEYDYGSVASSDWSPTYTFIMPDTPSTSTSPNPTPSPSPSPSPEPQEQEQPQQTEPFPTVLVAVAVFVVTFIIGEGLLVYFKKRRGGKTS